MVCKVLWVGDTSCPCASGTSWLALLYPREAAWRQQNKTGLDSKAWILCHLLTLQRYGSHIPSLSLHLLSMKIPPTLPVS